MMKRLAMITLLVATSSHAAGIPTEQALELCRAEQNALKRLLCYDTINTGSTQNSSVAPSATAPATAAQQPQEFGKEHRNFLPEDAPEQVYMTVRKISYDPYKSLIVEFDNGQVWQQLGTEYYSIKAGEKHYIKRGVMNSFLLGSDDGRKAIRVRRED
ncbi:hypothetical protein [Rheinheimera maricola]|uniref:Type IV pilus biogenesis protein PilP n=1 Tax=Rheinheimera maricola TaxID=2793282 RepID=A0ABS7XDP7_9GAMM|nr:hypothetical protein [Rheinheimera maricola]MBZ9613666.1 hypothetical protein [Rheinheimera maricola]